MQGHITIGRIINRLRTDLSNKPNIEKLVVATNNWISEVNSKENLYFGNKILLQYLALDVTADCICEIHCIALDGFDLYTIH